MKIKVYIAIMVALIGCALLINGFINEEGKQDVVVIDNTNKTTLITTSTNTTKTTKTSKATVKTTKKKVYKAPKVETASKQEYIDYAKSISGYNEKQMNCLINLWNHESGWNPNSVNKKSGACGIPQALPCSKIKNVEGSNDWKAQIRWGIKYINYRYKTPCKAWEYFKKKNWY